MSLIFILVFLQGDSKSFSIESGYYKTSDGLIIQWGHINELDLLLEFKVQLELFGWQFDIKELCCSLSAF